MSDTLITVIAIFLAAVLMFVFPLMTVSNTQDEISQVAVQSIVAEFVNNVASKGEITKNDYEAFTTKLYATGNTYDIQLEHKIMTTNPNKGEGNKAGESLYYSEFTSEIEKALGETGEYKLKKGDYIIATVKNTNITIATQLKNFLYSIVGKDTYTIAASSSALVVNTGY